MHAIKRKLILGFKYYRFKSLQSSAPTNVDVKDVFSLRSKKLSEIFDCSKSTAKELISKNKLILNLQAEDFIRNATFCCKHFRVSDIIEFPCILSYDSSLLHHRYFSLKELGCFNPTVRLILRFPLIMKQTPQVLLKEQIYFQQNQSIECFMDLLSDYSAFEKDEIKFRLQKMYDEGSSLRDIKEAMNAQFLVSKLNCSLPRIHHMFQRYPPLKLLSVSNTTHLVDVLFQKLNFTVSKVIQVPSLLSLHHEIVEQFIEKAPDILGINSAEIVPKIPLILKKPTDTIHQLEEVLLKFEISDKQLMCCPRILNFSPKTLEQRLHYLSSSSDFALLKSYKKFLWLVYHYNSLNSRLEALKALNIPCSITMFLATNSNFERYLSISKSHTHVDDITHYLSEIFNCSEKEILFKLREFPNIHNSSLINSSQVINVLLEAGVSKQQIYNGLGIILYDVDIVREYFKELHNYPACQPFEDWLNHYNLIQLLIYAIEVDHGFKASRSYKAGVRLQDYNELAVSGFGC